MGEKIVLFVGEPELGDEGPGCLRSNLQCRKEFSASNFLCSSLFVPRQKPLGLAKIPDRALGSQEERDL